MRAVFYYSKGDTVVGEIIECLEEEQVMNMPLCSWWGASLPDRELLSDIFDDDISPGYLQRVRDLGFSCLIDRNEKFIRYRIMRESKT